MVLVTPITPTHIVYRAETLTERAFESSVCDTTNLPKTNLKCSDGETSHRALSVCSVNASLRPPLANQADPDLDLKENIPLDLNSDLNSELKHQSRYAIDSQPAPPNFDTSHQSDSIESPGADLISRSLHDWNKSIEPDPIHLQPALPNFDTSYQPDSIEAPGADLISRSSYPYADPIEPDPIHPDPDQIHPQLPTIPNLIDSVIDPRSNQTQLAPVDLTSQSYADRLTKSIEPLGADLTSQSLHDRDKSIYPILILVINPIRSRHLELI
jgi:hypothetical protein